MTSINHEGISRVTSMAERVIAEVNSGRNTTAETTGTMSHEMGLIPEGRSFNDCMTDPNFVFKF